MEGPMDSVPMLCSGWLKLLEALHSVEYFAFDETCVTTDNSLMTATHILMLLGTMSRFTSSGAEGQGSCLMPNLKHLYLKSLLFRRTQFEPDSEPDNLLVEILCDSLVAHAAQDGDTTEGGLEEVIFRRCYNIFEKDIETVEEYVAVDWDGESMEKVFSDEDSEEN
ncbi:hypothetical protein EUX98_g4575 [Antrodiella citrinella]|uniref:Uncharacterized protein n=1 Tax=Antrodiella citrinella TaxID=2447956 RepID=A0A4S4MTS3_9APHY|nr:hypothetical protein EUX98_g4575 [Antrodiella citrinella]